MERAAIISCFAITLLLIIAGCHSTPQKYMATKEEAQKEKIEQKSGIANPASTFCINQSGNAWSVKEDSQGNQFRHSKV
ncbi:hypothetical protein HZB90_00740 [archaeon]|nr:hypothetical protein [archaeon]